MLHRYGAPLLLGAAIVGISCNDVSVAPQVNVPPVVVINAPEDGSVVTEGTAIQFRATIADDDSLGDIQSVVWTSSLDGELGDPEAVMPDTQGASRLSAALGVGLHTVEVRVTDRAGEEATDSIGLTVEAMEQMPSAEIVTPTAFQEYDLGADVDFSGVVQDPNQAPETLTATWVIEHTSTGDILGPFTGLAGTGGITTARILNVVEGNYLATLTVTDDDLNEADASVYFVVIDPRDRDEDEDGWTPNQGDCDDGDPAAFPNNAEICDGIDNNCDGIIDNKDVDGDRHIDEQCDQYDGALPYDDCDDTNPAVHPLAPEISDGLDNDCNGIADDSTPTYDNDGDCFCIGPDPCTGSSNPACTTLDVGDCNDNNPDIDPVDDDNDGASECAGDCDDADPALNVQDLDTDGFTTCDGDCNDDDRALRPSDVDGDGFSTCDGDCDDSAAGGAWSFPGNTALDVCNGRNEDCDGSVDEDPERIYYPDLDGDGFIDPNGYVYACTDPDGPGLGWTSGTTAADCDDDPAACGADCFPNNGADDICDGYNQDCDAQIDEDVDRVWYHDADGDGFTAPGDTQSACDDPDGAGTEWVDAASTLDDCDDDPAECGADCFPDNTNPDVCDGLDQDCDAAVDEDADIPWYADADGDGYTVSSDILYACADPGLGWAPNPSTDDDCDDDPLTCGADCFPGNTDPDICDTYNQDCDAELDEDPDLVWYADADDDGWTDNSTTLTQCEDPGVGWSDMASSTTDCDDDPGLCGADCYPTNTSPDLCDSYDQDCDVAVDENPDIDWFLDADGDGATLATAELSCVAPSAQHLADASPLADCDDDPGACGAGCYPGNTDPDICDEQDQDCDASIDEDIDITWYQDADGDGFTGTNTQASCVDIDGTGAEWLAAPTAEVDCDDGTGASDCGADCFPNNPVADICDGFDQDCDAATDEDPNRTWYHDADADGFTNNSDTQVVCDDPDGAATRWVAVTTTNDCDDDPGACGAGCYPANANPDICDTYNQDCDASVDEDPDVDWFLDADGDGATLATAVYSCTSPGATYVADASASADCDDNPSACGADCFPNNPAADICDTYNQDCDASVDEDPEVTWYQDEDRDGFTGTNTQLACSDPDGATLGWLASPTAQADCDDNPGDCGNDCFPGNPDPDICDGDNQDCDASVDEDPQTPYYHDADGDGYTNNNDVQFACADPDGIATGWLINPSVNDCDDDPSACGADCFPNNSAPDICDGYNQDCNGQIDEDPDITWYQDADGDGFTGTATQLACDDPDGAAGGWLDAATAIDCQDTGVGAALAFPTNTAADICDGINQDCDAATDENPEFDWFEDADGDGYTGANVQFACTDPDGAGSRWQATAEGDCDDNPGACGVDCNPGRTTDGCDSYNNDCDASVDENPDITWYADLDQDDWTNNSSTQQSCTDPGVQWDAAPSSLSDCNDGSAALNHDDQDNDGQTTCAGDCNDGSAFQNTLDEDNDGYDTCTGGDCNDDPLDDGASYNPGVLDLPDALFDDVNCDGTDGDLDLAILMSPTGTDGSSCGLSSSTPCQSMDFSASRAISTGRNIVYIGSGTYSGVQAISSRSGVDFYGGFDTSWVRDVYTANGHAARFEGGEYAPDGQRMVIRLRSSDVAIDNVVLDAPDADGLSGLDGKSSYGIHSVDSTLTLTNANVLGGIGVSGTDGADGESASTDRPTSARNGSDGGEYNTGCSCDASSRRTGGDKATNPSCPTGTAGGDGGDSGTVDSSGCGTFLCACTTNCSATAGLAGGNAATYRTNDYGYRGGGGSANNSGTSGKGGAGGPGRDGDPGASGAGGSGGARTGGLIGAYWYAGSGTEGGFGGDGTGGGGGGGGGSSDNGIDDLGGGGGGGGAGGCGAPDGGNGGGGGGGSFGVFAVNSVLDIRGNNFEIGTGGAGGDGGVGGSGQPGGFGGSGGTDGGTSGGVGGDGGDGANGGSSGGGGGGAGGSAYGIFRADGASTSLTRSGNSFSPGSGGSGGSGGTSPTPSSNGGAGEAGLSASVGSI